MQKPFIPIIYQDDSMVVVHKPAGLFVHKSWLDRHQPYFLLQCVRDQVGRYLYPVHRLDRPTSGIMVFALNKISAQQLSTQFSEREVQKIYVALVRGYLDDEGVIDYPLKPKLDAIANKLVQQEKSEQTAITYYQTLQRISLPFAVGRYDTVRYSLVKVMPKTGRKHQIRRHLAHLRHPLIGDINYGDNKQNPFFAQQFGLSRLMLFAKALAFQHPETGELMRFELPFEQEWQQLFIQLNWPTEVCLLEPSPSFLPSETL